MKFGDTEITKEQMPTFQLMNSNYPYRMYAFKQQRLRDALAKTQPVQMPQVKSAEQSNQWGNTNGQK